MDKEKVTIDSIYRATVEALSKLLENNTVSISEAESVKVLSEALVNIVKIMRYETKAG